MIGAGLLQTQRSELRSYRFLYCLSEVTAVTVRDVQATDDNVFTTTVTAPGGLPEHVLVDSHTHTHIHTRSMLTYIYVETQTTAQTVVQKVTVC